MEDLPEVTVHFAQSLDGRIATLTGESRWISGEASLRLAHELRAAHRAVLVGVGTVLTDNPSLTVRLVAGQSPLRVVVDSTLRTPVETRLATDGLAPTVIATTPRAAPSQVDGMLRIGVTVVQLPADGLGRVSLVALLRWLAARGVGSLLVEGGRAVITSVLTDRLASRMVVTIAPKLLGEGVSGVGDLGVRRLGDALAFADAKFVRLGEDLVFDGRLERRQRVANG